MPKYVTVPALGNTDAIIFLDDSTMYNVPIVDEYCADEA